MKKIFSAFLLILIILSMFSCSDDVTTDISGEEEITAQPESAEMLSEQIGFDVSAPATAKDAEYYILNNVIAQINFSFNNILYEYRSSKIYRGEQLHKKNLDNSTKSELDINGRATVELYRDQENGTVAQWYINGTAYSLYSVKNASDDAVIELCDLLIP